MILAHELLDLNEKNKEWILFRQAQKIVENIEYEYCYKSAANGAKKVKCNLDWVAGFDDELLEHVILALWIDEYEVSKLVDNVIEIKWGMEK